MYQLLTSLLFAGAFITALTVIAGMFASHWDKMATALMMQPLRRQPAPWRIPPRRPARSSVAMVSRRPGLSRAAA
jgi:hypothetical protein